ncbi:kinase-like protein [Gigaspora margarita]|uniref:Kinase-like protein n=1 Tax=Gigaspora margarita TaxID=4874 RepID=A0A8H4ELM8_GIGMA|nr:kinase-like protein [Gigaspora margarita]
MSNWLEVTIKQKYISTFDYGSFKDWKVIGNGGFGVVHSAQSSKIGKTVALKSLYYNKDDDHSLDNFIKEHDGNILVDNGRLMISDFGLSKSLDNNSKSIAGGTTAFSDPQYLQDQSLDQPLYKRDKPSDIYSLGVLFWELSSGVPPFKNIESQIRIALRVIKGGRETPINGTPVDFMNIYRDAWNGDPNSHPKIEEIRDRLDNIRMIPVYHSDTTSE